MILVQSLRLMEMNYYKENFMISQSLVCRTILGSFFLFMPLITSAQAGDRPTVCPSINELKNVSFVFAEKTPAFPGKWYVMQQNNLYGTKASWDFAIIVDEEATDDMQAVFQKAMIALSDLSTPTGPRKIGDNVWMCEYQLPFGPEAVAFSPSSYQ